MKRARQEWLDWEFDPPGFATYGCDDIGDLLASGQMSLEYLDDDEGYLKVTEARLREQELRRNDFRDIRSELVETVSYQDGETESQYEDRITMQASKLACNRESQRAKERTERGLPPLDYDPDILF